jgi:trans-2,3-dihydro-3-hydroxyanthranilate isomerase
MTGYAIADVFTEKPLQGNPVAVFLDAAGIPADGMQRIAGEMNLSETTFVLPPEKDGDARVRIFTPVNELPFAGHPLLGTAAVLGANRSSLRLETAMGTIPFALEHNGSASSATMCQPVPTWESYEHTDHLLSALGLSGSTLPVDIYRNGPRHVFVGLPTVAALSAVQPDQRALAEHLDVAVNCFAPAEHHWRTRMFSPAYGVAEDAATGSAAGPLAVHLLRHNQVGYGGQVDIWQGVEMGRPSLMRARVTGSDDRLGLIEVSGSAVVVARGEFAPNGGMPWA